MKFKKPLYTWDFNSPTSLEGLAGKINRIT